VSQPKPTERHLYGRWRFVEDPATKLVHNVVDENAIDLIRLNGWIDRGRAPDQFAKYVPPAKPQKPAPVHADTGAEADDDDGAPSVDKPLIPDSYAADDQKAPLYDARKALVAAGFPIGDIKRNWGLTRLRAELEKWKALQ